MKNKENNMEKKERDKLVQYLVTKFFQMIKSLNQGQNFPFGDYLLTRHQVLILMFVAHHPKGVPVKDLAKFLSVTPGAITQSIDALVENKLVIRRTGAKDRRLTKIFLSPPAKSKFQKFKKSYLASASIAFSALNCEELTEFTKLLDKIKV